jgi:hypothetical protein
MRRYLPLGDPLRTDPKFGEPELRGPPNLRTNTDAQSKGLEALIKNKAVDGYYGPCMLKLGDERCSCIGCDLAHNMKVKGKDLIDLMKGKCSMSEFPRPVIKKEYREKSEYQDANGCVDESKLPKTYFATYQQKLVKWKKRCDARVDEMKFVNSCKLTKEVSGINN